MDYGLFISIILSQNFSAVTFTETDVICVNTKTNLQTLFNKNIGIQSSSEGTCSLLMISGYTMCLAPKLKLTFLYAVYLYIVRTIRWNASVIERLKSGCLATPRSWKN